ncbi:MAG: ATP F0F1 synthase subunit B [Neomegalonema sp.]|nr:ATP F0F1 synthase subunit B [Neomegalonema sp.]
MIAYAGDFLALDNSETWVIIAFLLFIALLFYVGAHTIIGNALDQRAEGIRSQLDNARSLREQAQTKLAEIERKQQVVKTQAAEIVEKAKRDAQEAAKKAKEDIAASVAQRQKAAEDQIAAAEAEAVRRVRNEAVDAATVAASAAMKKAMSGGDRAASIDDAINDVIKRLN